MEILDELIHYCKTEKPIGTLAFLGESGSGKTYLVEKELQEALQDSHVIVRVSLFGISSLSALHGAVRKQWFAALVPLCYREKLDPEKISAGENFFKAVNTVLKVLQPKAGTIGNTAASVVDNIEILPTVMDVHSKSKKRVVLVFDDADRSLLNPMELLGVINDYCENRNFNTILIANREKYLLADSNASDAIRLAKEKTIAYTLYNLPDHGRIIHELIADRSWKTEEYAGFLKQHEETIAEIFGSSSEDEEEIAAGLGKCHNLRSLITGLESFYRIYYHMSEAGISDIEPYLCAFLPLYLARRSGVFRDGQTSFSYTDEELRRLYPRFSTEDLFESVRQWICQGYWNRELFEEEFSRVRGSKGE